MDQFVILNGMADFILNFFASSLFSHNFNLFGSFCVSHHRVGGLKFQLKNEIGGFSGPYTLHSDKKMYYIDTIMPLA